MPLPQVLVPVQISAALDFGIVDVQSHHAPQAYRRFDFPQHQVQARLLRQVVAERERVRGVDTHAEHPVVVDRVEDRREVAESPAYQAAVARGVFQKKRRAAAGIFTRP